jgi:hypothetical protein
VARAPAAHLVQQSEDLPHFLEAQLHRSEPTERCSRTPSLSRRPVAGARFPPNIALLQEGGLSAVLHHDLALDLRRACHVVMQAHGALSGSPRSWHSGIQVITSYNIPAEALSEP